MWFVVCSGEVASKTDESNSFGSVNINIFFAYHVNFITIVFVDWKCAKFDVLIYLSDNINNLTTMQVLFQLTKIKSNGRAIQQAYLYRKVMFIFSIRE